MEFVQQGVRLRWEANAPGEVHAEAEADDDDDRAR